MSELYQVGYLFRREKERSYRDCFARIHTFARRVRAWLHKA